MNRILLIDDDESAGFLFKAVAKKAIGDLEFSQEFSGESALRWLGKNPVQNLIVCDWRLPDIDGLDLCERLQTAYPGSLVKVWSGHESEALEIMSKSREAIESMLTEAQRSEIERLDSDVEELGQRLEDFALETRRKFDAMEVVMTANSERQKMTLDMIQPMASQLGEIHAAIYMTPLRRAVDAAFRNTTTTLATILACTVVALASLSFYYGLVPKDLLLRSGEHELEINGAQNSLPERGQGRTKAHEEP